MKDTATRDLVIIALAACVISALWTAALMRGLTGRLETMEAEVAALDDRTAPLRFDAADLAAFKAEAARDITEAYR